VGKAPICPICEINECEWDSEPPGPGGYFDTCGRCTGLTGYRTHSHTYGPSEAQVQAGTFREGHTWRTSRLMRPIWEGGKHVGYRCADVDPCGFEERFSGDDFDLCPIHAGPRYGQVIKGQCRNHQDHRVERGECDKRGYITEHGRREERRRADEQNRPAPNEPGPGMPGLRR
jgi:hypothetical protein